MDGNIGRHCRDRSAGTQSAPARPQALRSLITSEVSEVSSCLRDYIAPHTMRSLGGNVLRARLSCLDLGGLSAVELSNNAALQINADPVGDRHIIQLVLAGTCRIEVNARSYTLGAKNLMVNIPGHPAQITFSPGTRLLSVQMPKVHFEKYAQACRPRKHGRDGDTPFRDAVVRDVQIAFAWKKIIGECFLIAEEAPRVFRNERFQRNCVNLAMETLLQIGESAPIETIDETKVIFTSRQIERIVATIDEFIGDPLAVSWLARRLGVSIRKLQMGFARHFNCGPGTYIRNRRLDLLHVRLIESPPDAKVVDIMADLGVTSFGRFSGYYKERYGYLPAETKRK